MVYSSRSGHSIVPVAAMVPEISALQRKPVLLRILPLLVALVCSKRFHRHCSGQPALERDNYCCSTTLDANIRTVWISIIYLYSLLIPQKSSHHPQRSLHLRPHWFKFCTCTRTILHCAKQEIIACVKAVLLPEYQHISRDTTRLESPRSEYQHIRYHAIRITALEIPVPRIPRDLYHYDAISLYWHLFRHRPRQQRARILVARIRGGGEGALV